jgi:DNA-directed RNA polymerase specialized sigma subunit
VVPFLSDIFGQAAKDLEAATEQLRVELGREPTRDEVGERIAATHGGAASPLMPEAR